MSHHCEIVPPDQYWQVLLEMLDEDDHVDDECASDHDNEENIQHNDHDFDSECD